MSKIFVRLILISMQIILLIGCSSNAKRELSCSERNAQLLIYLKAENELLKKNEINIDGQLEGDSISVKYKSIEPGEYYKAFEENAECINYFSHGTRINEVLREGATRKNDSLLTIEGYDKNITFKDNKKSRTKFLYENEANDFHIVKSYEFEDAYTYFVNKWTGEIDYKLWGTLVEVYPKEDLLFYTNGTVFGYDQKTEVSFFRVNTNGIDTLLNAQTKWFASHTFITSPYEIYYVHRAYDESSGMKSSYAKMEVSATKPN